MTILSSPTSFLHALSLASLLSFAAWRDVISRTIPDRISITLLVIGSLIRLSQGFEALLLSWCVAIAIFLLLLPLCARGLMGGADLKLLSALAVGLAPQSTLQLLLDVTLCGGALAALYLGVSQAVRRSSPSHFSRGTARSTVGRIASVEFWRIRRGAPLPYGVAIAAGAAVAFLNQQGV